MRSKLFQNLDKSQVAAFGPCKLAKRKIETLLTDIVWTEHSAGKGRELQYQVNNKEEAQNVLERIKSLFDGFDLDIELKVNENSSVLMTIPSYVLKGIADGTIKLPSPARNDLSKLLATNEIDIILIGESHDDSAARSILIDNIDLISDAPREITVLIEHLPNKEGKYYENGFKDIDVIQEVSSCLSNKEISKKLVDLIKDKTSYYYGSDKPDNEYVTLAECCINNGVGFGGAENVESKNTSVAGDLLKRVINGDKAFIHSIEDTRKLQNQSQDRKQLIILLCGQAHLPGLKKHFHDQGIQVYSWAIRNIMQTENTSKQTSVNSETFSKDMDNKSVKDYLTSEYPEVTVDMQSVIDLEKEKLYSADAVQAKNRQKNMETTSDFKEKINQIKTDAESINDEIYRPQ